TITSRGRSHDPVLAIIDFERTIFLAFASIASCIHNKTADKTFGRSELFLRDLMTKRAGNSILSHLSQAIIGAELQAGKHLSFLGVGGPAGSKKVAKATFRSDPAARSASPIGRSRNRRSDANRISAGALSMPRINV